MAKLNQIIAIANGKKSRAQQVITEVHHKLAKPDLLSGLSRTYRPKDEDGDKLPDDLKLRQYSVFEGLDTAGEVLCDLWDTVATQDEANTYAKGVLGVMDGVGGVPLSIPVTTLLFLEKQLVDVHTLISKLPVLDPTETWHWDSAKSCYVTAPTETVRSKKVPKAFEASPATKEHPAQVQVFHEDVVAGYWSQVKFSGAIPQDRKTAILRRVEKMQDSIKKAREEANCCEATEVSIGKKIWNFLLNGQD